MLKAIPLPAALVAAGITAFAAFQGVDPSTLPDDAGKALLSDKCGGCHDLGTVTVKRLTPPEWKDVVDDMVSRGVQADDNEIKQLTVYLSAHVGRVNVNKASADDLATVLGLAADEAAAIVKARSDGAAFKTVEDLKKIPGVDVKKLDDHKDAIAFSDR